MSLKSFVSYSFLLLSGCSGGPATHDQAGESEVCPAAALKVCREVTPGVFKSDDRGFCDEAYENEVPADYCQPGRERQAAISEELLALDAELSLCQVDADCHAIVVTPSCAFGCGLAVNQNADPTRRNQLVEEFNSYTMCQAQECAPAAAGFVGPRCDKGHCVNAP